MSFVLFTPLIAVVFLLFFRSFNFTQFQGFFIIAVVSSVLISQYTETPIWWPIASAVVGEVIVNVFIGIKGKSVHSKVYNYLLTAVGLFPWFISPWASLGYSLTVAAGFGVGAWGRKGATSNPIYSFDLMGIFAGILVASLIIWGVPV